MVNRPLEVLYEDNHLLAVNKPPGLATMGVAAGEDSLIVRAKHYIKRQYGKPGNVYLGIVSRLDTGTSGAVVFARTSKAAARLSAQFRSRQVQKTYWAIVSGRVEPAAGEPAAGELVDWVMKDDAAKRMRVVGKQATGAQEARLRYRLLREVAGGSLLEIDLLTGRKHQIRLQLAERGWPVWGEKKYGHTRSFGGGLALHAQRLVLEHPVRKISIDLVAPLPRGWQKLGI